jgi:type II secretory pathway component GspD/PulD (secretin)/beta-lactamase regulating signal transducer with metallopeptidase domain
LVPIAKTPTGPTVIAEATGNLDPIISPAFLDTPERLAEARVTAHAPGRWSSRAIWWPGAVWGAGLAALLLRMTLARAVFAVGLWRRRKPIEAEVAPRVDRLAAELGFRRRVRLLSMTGLATPVSFGALRPSIALPERFVGEHRPDHQEAMLAHELAHIVGRDALWHGLADLVAALCWWHPAVWWMRRSLMVSSELAADDASLVVENGPQVLAECLLTTARRLVGPAGAGWQGMNGGRFRSSLGRRVERLLGPLSERRTIFVPAWQRGLALLLITVLLASVAVLGTWVGGRGTRDPSAASLGDSWRGSIAQLLLAQVTAAEAGDTKPGAGGDAIAWRTWSREAVDAARGSGHPVVVFFTADWCVSGAVLEKTVLQTPAIGQRLRELQAIAFRADATLATNPAIDAELKARNRGGVPMTLVYPADASREPELLPEVFTTAMVLAACDRTQRAASIPGSSQERPRSTEALATSAATPAATEPARPILTDVEHQLVLAKSLYQVGLLAEAREKFKAVLANEPQNAEARQYLSLVESRRPGGGAPTAKRLALGALLDSIVIESFGGVRPLSEMVSSLAAAVRAHDGDGASGIDFLINGPTNATSSGGGAGELGAVLVQIQPPLRDASVRRILDAMVKGGGHLIRYEVEDYAVVFSPVPEVRREPPLATRMFPVNAQRIAEALRQRLGREAAIEPGATVTSGDAIVFNLVKYFQRAGVDLQPPSAPLQGGRQPVFRGIFYNSNGTLLVRATRDELGTVERELQSLNAPPPQVVLETRFCEIPEDIWSELAGAWAAVGAAKNTATNRASNPSTRIDSRVVDARKLTASEAEQFINEVSQRRGVNLMTMPRVTTIAGRQAQIKVVEIRPVVVPDVPGPNYAGVTLGTNRTEGTGPNVQREGSAGAGNLKFEQFENGPVLDVIPWVLEDGVTVDLAVTATVNEFIGYDLDPTRRNFDNRLTIPRAGGGAPSLPPIIGPEVSREVRAAEGSGARSASTPVPLYRNRQMLSTARVWDGQSLLLVGGKDALEVVGRTNDATRLGDLPFVGRFFRDERARKPLSKLVVLVTVRIIDPAGNAVHRDDEIPPGVP